MEKQKISKKQKEDIKQVSQKRDQLTYSKAADPDVKIAVYTVMNSKEQLQGEVICTNRNWSYICFTDNDNVKAEGWEIRKLPALMENYNRNAEMIKTLPHLFLDEYDISIWVDNSSLIRDDHVMIAEQLPINKNIVLLSYTGDEIMLPFEKINSCGFKKNSIQDEKKQNKALKSRLVKELKKDRGLAILIRHNTDQVTLLMQECWAEMVRNEAFYDYLKKILKKVFLTFPFKPSIIKKLYKEIRTKNDHTVKVNETGFSEKNRQDKGYLGNRKIVYFYPFTRKPLEIENLEITTKIGCSNMCNYCPQDSLMKSYNRISAEKNMSIETFKNSLNKISKEAAIGFTGMSEPFLNPSCMQMIEYAKSKGHKIYISTTLTGLKKEDIKRLENINFTHFLIHLPSDGGDRFPKDHEYREKLSLIINSRISNKSYHYHGAVLHPSAEIAKDLVEKKRINSRSGNLNCSERFQVNGPITCQRDFAQPVLLPNGDLVLCCMDYSLNFVIGNLNKQDPVEIYQGSKFSNLVIFTLKNNGSICHDCEDYRIML